MPYLQNFRFCLFFLVKISKKNVIVRYLKSRSGYLRKFFNKSSFSNNRSCFQRIVPQLQITVLRFQITVSRFQITVPQFQITVPQFQTALHDFKWSAISHSTQHSFTIPNWSRITKKDSPFLNNQYQILNDHPRFQKAIPPFQITISNFR